MPPCPRQASCPQAMLLIAGVALRCGGQLQAGLVHHLGQHGRASSLLFIFPPWPVSHVWRVASTGICRPPLSKSCASSPGVCVVVF